jgi:hypothetical protein
LIAQTIPAENIPSKKILIGLGTSNKTSVNEIMVIDKKNPTQVDVHKTQEIKSPKNFDRFFMNSLNGSNIEPQTIIDVIP